MLVPPPSLRRKPESRRLDPHDTELSPTRSIAGTIVIFISVNVLQLTGQGVACPSSTRTSDARAACREALAS